MPVVGRDPTVRPARPLRTDGDRDRFIRNRAVGLVASLVLLVSRAVVEELVRQQRLVIVAECVEGADRIGVVGKALIARNVAHRRPGLAAIEGLVEAEQVVIALGAGKPL